MTQLISRRQFIASAAAASAVIGAGGIHTLTAQEAAAPGGIGWPRAEFETKFGSGSEAHGLVKYTSPDGDGYDLTVHFEDDIASFIDLTVPDPAVNQEDVDSHLKGLLPADAASVATWIVNDIDDSPFWLFQQYTMPSMHMAGSGSTEVIATTATTTAGIVRAALSLAMPDYGNEFAPGDSSLGPGNTIDEWIDVYGDGRDGHGAMGHYDGTWDITPWDKVVVYSHRGEPENAVIDQISAITAEGVSQADAETFAVSILPVDAALESGYGAFAVPGRNQGWGMSVWQSGDARPVLLFILGAGDDSGDVLQVATVSAGA